MKNKNPVNDFGKRLIKLRKEKGFTQTELGNKIGLSKRMVTYYERGNARHPVHLLVPIANALNVSLDVLLGVKHLKQQLDPENAKLWRRLKKAEHLSLKDRKALFDFLDALLVRSKSKKYLPNNRGIKNSSN